MTLRQAIAAGAARLAVDSHLAPTAERDARTLLLHHLRLTRVALFADSGRELPPHHEAAFSRLLDRRLAHEPVQYITGRQEFYGINLRVTPAVLIPRPETELLVEAVLDRLPGDRPLRLLDIGTGSGAIAIALAAHMPAAAITATDISPAALSVAADNAREHRLDTRIRLLASDLLAAVANERFDCIVGNPPYVPAPDRDTLHPQVRDHEPDLALFAGPDGLAIYRRLIPAASTALVAGGLLALEIGHGQQSAVRALLLGWDDVQFLPDLQGIPRVALARATATA